MLNYMSDKNPFRDLAGTNRLLPREMHKSTLYLLPLHEIWQSVLSCTSQ